MPLGEGPRRLPREIDNRQGIAAAEDLPEVGELDLNPLLARPDGCVVVDARVRVRPSGAEPARKSW